MEDVAKLREQAYLTLIEHGLVLLRNFAHTGRVDLCQIEADHLHNIPTLLHEENEYRHVFYIRAERRLYLDRLRATGTPYYLEQVEIWFAEPWRVLAQLVGDLQPGQPG